MLAYHRREKEKSSSESCNDCHAALSEREKAGLQYVSGYVRFTQTAPQTLL